MKPGVFLFLAAAVVVVVAQLDVTSPYSRRYSDKTIDLLYDTPIVGWINPMYASEKVAAFREWASFRDLAKELKPEMFTNGALEEDFVDFACTGQARRPGEAVRPGIYYIAGPDWVGDSSPGYFLTVSNLDIQLCVSYRMDV